MANKILMTYERLYEILGDANRLRILAMLKKKRMCVCELSHILRITPPSVSRHMKKMKTCGLVSDEQDGYWTIYGLSKQIDAETEAIVMQAIAAVSADETVKKDSAKAAGIDRAAICNGH